MELNIFGPNYIKHTRHAGKNAHTQPYRNTRSSGNRRRLFWGIIAICLEDKRSVGEEQDIQHPGCAIWVQETHTLQAEQPNYTQKWTQGQDGTLTPKQYL